MMVFEVPSEKEAGMILPPVILNPPVPTPAGALEVATEAVGGMVPGELVTTL
jgi:hypothetical protein